MVPGVSPSFGHVLRRPRDAALARCRVTTHGLSLLLEPSGGVSAGLLHFPLGTRSAGGMKRTGPLRWLQALRPVRRCCAVLHPSIRTSRAPTRVVVSGKRPKEES